MEKFGWKMLFMAKATSFICIRGSEIYKFPLLERYG